MVNRDVLKEQFLFLGISDITDEVLDRCQELCIVHSIDEEELVETWMAFSMSHLEGADPTLETLTQMERRELSKKKDQPQHLQQSKPRERTLVIYNSNDSANLEIDPDEEILEAYNFNSTPKAKNKFEKRLDHTPDNRPAGGRSPRIIFSPASFSPTVATPSSKYKGRTNKGDVLCTFGEKQSADWRRKKGNEYQPDIKLLPPCMEANTSYMFNQLRDIAQVLDEATQFLGEKIVSLNGLDEPQPIDAPHQNECVVVGRVCCDSDGRLNAKSLMLESVGGITVPMEVLQAGTYSLFPGQVVAMEASNPLGEQLEVSRIYSDASKQPLPPASDFSTEETGPIQIVVAAGPFTQSDTMTYQPLEDLVEYVKENNPHLLILIGPFVDTSHPQVVEGLLAESFQACFEKLVESFMDPLKELKTQVVLVPSLTDAHHQMVYPVPPFILRKNYNKLTLASDPCMLSIQGIVIGVTSTDVLLHLGKEEIAQVSPGSDRLGRIASHVIHQQNFYPLYPPAEDVNLDLELWGEYAFFEAAPHILILPSSLRCFIKNLNGTVTVNPERLAKGMVGGNFARLEVSCIDSQLNICGQVVKI